MSFSVSRASTTKHVHAGELLSVHPRGKSIKSRLTSVIRRRTASGAADEDTGATHINTLLDDVQEFEQELERFYWHTKDLKSKLADAFSASHNMVADAMQLWKDGQADTQQLQECQRILGEIDQGYQRQFMAEIDRELLGPIGADMTMFKQLKEKATRREQYLRDVKYYKSKMDSLDPSRDPDRYSRNEEKLFTVQHAMIEETKSLIHDMKGIERAKQTMLDHYLPKAVALQRELWLTIVQQSQPLDSLPTIVRNRRLNARSFESPTPSTTEPALDAANATAAPPSGSATASTAAKPTSPIAEDETAAVEEVPSVAQAEVHAAPKPTEEEIVPFSKRVLNLPEPIAGLDLEFEVTLNTERAPGLVLHKRLVTTSSQLKDIEYAAVNLVLPGSIADMLGIRKGDIITRVNGLPVVNAAFDSVKEEIRNYVKPMTVQFARVSHADLLAHPPGHWKVLALTEECDEHELQDAASEYGDEVVLPTDRGLAREDSDMPSSLQEVAAVAKLHVPSGPALNSPNRSKTPANTPRAGDVSSSRETHKSPLQEIPENDNSDTEPRRLALPIIRDVPDDESDAVATAPASSPISDIRTQLARTFEQQPDLEAGLLPRIAPLPLATAPPETEFQIAAPTPFSTPLQRTSKTSGQHRAAAHSISSHDGSSAPSTPFVDDELHSISCVQETDECDDETLADTTATESEPQPEPNEAS